MPFGHLIVLDYPKGGNLVPSPAVVRSAGGAGGNIRKHFFVGKNRNFISIAVGTSSAVSGKELSLSYRMRPTTSKSVEISDL